ALCQELTFRSLRPSPPPASTLAGYFDHGRATYKVRGGRQILVDCQDAYQRRAVKEQHLERRLAAILAMDVAGYSRLMGVEEVGTLQALKAHRKGLIDSAIASHHGRIVKTTGDGMLVE